MALQAAMSLSGIAQTRDELVREDRRKITDEGFWIYNDLPKAFVQQSKQANQYSLSFAAFPATSA